MQPLPPATGDRTPPPASRDPVASAAVEGGSTATPQAPSSTNEPPPKDGKKRRKHRGGKKRRNRRQSFAAPSENSAFQSVGDDPAHDPLIEEPEAPTSIRQRFYRHNTGSRSHESLESEALLDHREQRTLRPRRDSRVAPALFAASYRPGGFPRLDTSARRRHHSQQDLSSPAGSDHDDVSDRTPLILAASQRKSPVEPSYGLFRSKSHTSSLSAGSRQPKKRPTGPGHSFPRSEPEYDVNNPPSVPPSPTFGAHFGDVMVDDPHFLTRSPDSRRNLHTLSQDALIDIDGDGDGDDDGGRDPNSAPPSPRLRPDGFQRQRAMTLPAEEDVCFPRDEVSEVGDEYFNRVTSHSGGRRRRRNRKWPQLWILDEWSRVEKEERAGERRAKKISEPVFVGGRLRPTKTLWHRVDEDVQYRYTYFNEEFESTIHAQTISELVQPGGTFRELFIPDPPELDDSSSSGGGDDDDEAAVAEPHGGADLPSAVQSPKSQPATEPPALLSAWTEAIKVKLDGSAKTSDVESFHKKTTPPPKPAGKPKKYGPRPTFWLDVLNPSDEEMRVLSKAFGIHALTSEDIMMQEAREKVELFRNYYFINYRTFEQDTSSDDYLDPINMYVCVFRHGILTFHFSQIPHPANVRRRIRQLSDYLILSADWISYAIIDDITDVYQPLITSIEEEVDTIDDLILKACRVTNALAGVYAEGKDHRSDISEIEVSGADLLMRIGECRKKVMSLYRLLGTKADVIKGFAKRCSDDRWDIAPTSEIALYLGDIQDHILTMTSNLSHYENLLSRSHSNFLAQVSIDMNERQEKTADVLGKLTVLGTIVLPMNIVTGMFGGNFKVPGQEVDNLNWFWGTTVGLVLFGFVCFYWCKKVYKIV